MRHPKGKKKADGARPGGVGAWTAPPISEGNSGKTPIVELLEILAGTGKETKQLLNGEEVSGGRALRSRSLSARNLFLKR